MVGFINGYGGIYEWLRCNENGYDIFKLGRDKPFVLCRCKTSVHVQSGQVAEKEGTFIIIFGISFGLSRALV